MGLPSGLLWASANVGAASPSDSGLFFSWGNTEGHAEGSGYDFSQVKYDQTPAASINTDLSLAQDMARANLGEPWRMPTAIECQELYDNCTYEWTTIKGIEGILFRSNVNGNELFFPATGGYNGKTLTNRGSFGFIWLSTYISESYARRLDFSSSQVRPQGVGTRRYGFTVRAVYGPNEVT